MAKQYNGAVYDVSRVEAENGPYEYEFVLTVDGNEVMTATTIERKYGIAFDDFSTNWTTVLYTFAEAYIDTGSEAEAVERTKREHVN